MSTIQNRLTEVLRDGEWREIPFEDVKKGDTVAVFEESGVLVCLCSSESDAYINA